MKSLAIETRLGVKCEKTIWDEDEVASITRTAQPSSLEGSPMEYIVIRTLFGKTFSLSVKQTDTIKSMVIKECLNIKLKLESGSGQFWVRVATSTTLARIQKVVEDKFGISAKEQKLTLHDGSPLCDSARPLRYYNVKNEAEIFVSVKNQPSS